MSNISSTDVEGFMKKNSATLVHYWRPMREADPLRVWGILYWIKVMPACSGAPPFAASAAEGAEKDRTCVRIRLFPHSRRVRWYMVSEKWKFEIPISQNFHLMRKTSIASHLTCVHIMLCDLATLSKTHSTWSCQLCKAWSTEPTRTNLPLVRLRVIKRF